MASSSNQTSLSQSSITHDSQLKLVLQTEASEFMSRGLTAYANQDFETAVSQLSQGVVLIEQIYGPMSVLTADALFNYGRALLENAVKNTDLLGEKNLSKDAEKPHEDEEEGVSGSEEDEEEEEDEAPDMSKKIFSFQAEIDLSDNESEVSAEPEKQDNQAQEDKAEDEDDFALAWQSFDSARVIYMHHLDQQPDAPSSSSNPPPTPENIRKIRHKLGEVLLALGDLSLESENFQQAIIDYQEAVQAKQQCLEPHDRRIAEAIYKLAVAYEYLPDRPNAIAHLNLVNDVLEAHIALLDTNTHAAEIKEVKDLLQDIKIKLEDLAAPQPDLVPELTRGLVNVSSNTGFEGPQENARDVNTLIKRKNMDTSSDSSQKRQHN
ncbi:hypothetical protein DSO57_1030810 [Entomophthora muscae]|uniref:Uncharacterized protein n=2 Tax=Entomophthora muscae TaxID=34485 RepID=A0ACC2SDS6_9FUNG|nr:hypothetical protein DSO57_1030810 [Entomophthora muscae]